MTRGAPDKLCDAIADGVLDACLAEDPGARVACEVLATAGKITVAGEITARVLPDIPAIAARTVRETGYEADYEIEALTHEQSPDIAEAVNGGRQTRAGDRGWCTAMPAWRRTSCCPCRWCWPIGSPGCSLTPETGDHPGAGPDGKAQVSVEYLFGLPSRIVSVVASCQHDEGKDLEELRREVLERVITPALEECCPRTERLRSSSTPEGGSCWVALRRTRASPAAS